MSRITAVIGALLFCCASINIWAGGAQGWSVESSKEALISGIGLMVMSMALRRKEQA